MGLPTLFKTTKKSHERPVKKKKKKEGQQSSGQIGRRSSSREPSAMEDLVLMEGGNPLAGDSGIVGCSYNLQGANYWDTRLAPLFPFARRHTRPHIFYSPKDRWVLSGCMTLNSNTTHRV